MGTVIMHNVVSVDGFIADENDAVKPLHEWYFNGDTPITGTRDQEFDHSGAGVLSKPGSSTSSPLTLSPSFWAGVDDCLTTSRAGCGGCDCFDRWRATAYYTCDTASRALRNRRASRYSQKKSPGLTPVVPDQICTAK